MSLYLTPGVTSQPLNFDSDVTYRCIKSDKIASEWPMQSTSTFFTTPQPKTSHVAYGVIVDCNLSIPVDNDESTHSVFAIIEFDTFKKDFTKFTKTFNEVVLNRIQDQDILKLWKDEQGIITTIGISDQKKIGTTDSKLAAIGLCNFQKDSFTSSNHVSFFCNNRPTCFAVEQLEDVKLIQLKQDEYTKFINEFKKAYLSERQKLRRTETTLNTEPTLSNDDDNLVEVPLHPAGTEGEVDRHLNNFRAAVGQSSSGCCALL